MFYGKLVYTVASIDTQCIDSNLESGRYISRVGWASRFLSLGTYGTVPRYLRYLRYLRRERNLLARPTLDMYLPLSKFESIHWVSIDATV